jgi:hypothetical protein
MTFRMTRAQLMRRALSIFLVAGTLFAVSMAGAGAAHASSIWASGDPILINVQTGGKNSGNHTQWVSSIYIQVPTAKNYGYGCGKFEAWTQNYYVTTQACGSQFYYISRWVATGNYVCGAFTPFGTAWPRAVACIAIRV